jgi:hypothetical protein
MRLRQFAIVALSLLASSHVACFPPASTADVAADAAAPNPDPDATPSTSDTVAAEDLVANPDAPQADVPTSADVGPSLDVDTAPDVEPGPDTSTADAGAESDTNTSPGIPLEALAQTYGQVYCARLARCEGLSDGGGLMSAFARSSPDACMAWLAERLQVEKLRDLEAGLIGYDPVAAAACLDRVAADCGADFAIEPVCAQVFPGRLELGQGCEESDTCQPGLHCRVEPRQAYCGGACVRSPSLGEPCKDAGWVCSQSDGPAYCEQDGDLCKPRPEPVQVRPGELCGRGAIAGQPESLGLCGDGYVCLRPPSASTSTCQPVLRPGDACGAEGACPIGTLCRAPSGTILTCQPVTVVEEPGSACDEGRSGTTFCNPFMRLGCNVRALTCERRDGLEGTPCSGLIGCKAGLVCSGVGLCIAPQADGARCGQDEECASGACLDGVCGVPACTSR